MAKSPRSFSRKYNAIMRDIEKIKMKINIISEILSRDDRVGDGRYDVEG